MVAVVHFFNENLLSMHVNIGGFLYIFCVKKNNGWYLLTLFRNITGFQFLNHSDLITSLKLHSLLLDFNCVRQMQDFFTTLSNRCWIQAPLTYLQSSHNTSIVHCKLDYCNSLFTTCPSVRSPGSNRSRTLLHVPLSKLPNSVTPLPSSGLYTG